MAKAPKTNTVFEVIKRSKSVIEYKIVGDESAEVLKETLKLDLTGYTFRPLRRGILFQFEGGKIAAENIRYWAFRGATKQLSLEASKAEPPSAKAKTTQSRGATPNVSILRTRY